MLVTWPNATGEVCLLSRQHKVPLSSPIYSIVRKTIEFDKIFEDVTESLGKVEAVYILDDYALGKDTELIDLLVVEYVDKNRLTELATITERKINRKERPGRFYNTCQYSVHPSSCHGMTSNSTGSKAVTSHKIFQPSSLRKKVFLSFLHL